MTHKWMPRPPSPEERIADALERIVELMEIKQGLRALNYGD